MEAVRAEPPPYRTVRAGEGEWQTLAPGLERKMLWNSGDAQSCLMRLAPGATVCGHLHFADEECIVLEGSVRIGADLVLRAGDFHGGRRGSEHAETSSETGALIYLRSAPEAASS
jgi:anti-sigma factor ChrR (cupin superfamily)